MPDLDYNRALSCARVPLTLPHSKMGRGQGGRIKDAVVTGMCYMIVRGTQEVSPTPKPTLEDKRLKPKPKS